MEKKKSILKSSLIASAIVACSGFTANATEVFSHINLGSSEKVRANLSSNSSSSYDLELNCGSKTKADESKSTDPKKGGKSGDSKKSDKEGKCGEGKCGEGKCGGSSKGKPENSKGGEHSKNKDHKEQQPTEKK